MLTDKTWAEFQESGMLYVTNVILQFFGWSIIIEFIDNEMIYKPARTKYRGFSEEATKCRHAKVAKYLQENWESIVKDALEE